MDSLVPNKPERRTAIMAITEVSWEDSDGIARTIAARMEDTSNSGACLRMSAAMQVGMILNVSWREGEFSGLVRYCRAEGRDYVIGIQRTAPNAAMPTTGKSATATRPSNGTILDHNESTGKRLTGIPANDGPRVKRAARSDRKPELPGQPTVPGDPPPPGEGHRVGKIAKLDLAGGIEKIKAIFEEPAFRALSTKAKRARVCAVLEGSETTMQRVLQDAERRLSALDLYEAELTKHLQDLEARKIRENMEIQEEMDRATSRFQDRLRHNLDEVAALRDPLNAWQTKKRQEGQQILELVRICRSDGDFD
jgi:hypothetical protein